MNIVLWAIAGMITGMIATEIIYFFKGETHAILKTNIALGDFGAIAGGIIICFVNRIDILEPSIESILFAIIGAITVILLGSDKH